MLMYAREYLIALFFPAQCPYWFVSVLPRNPIPFPYPYFPNPIPSPPKNIETKVKMRFFRPYPQALDPDRAASSASSRFPPGPRQGSRGVKEIKKKSVEPIIGSPNRGSLNWGGERNLEGLPKWQPICSPRWRLIFDIHRLNLYMTAHFLSLLELL